MAGTVQEGHSAVTEESASANAGNNHISHWPQLRELQRRLVRDLIIHGPQSRVELTRKLSLSRTSTSRLTQELEDMGLVRDGELVHSAMPGRPQELVQVRPDAAHFHGIELTPGRIHGVVIDLTASILVSRTEPVESSDETYLLDRIVAMHESLSEGTPPAVALGIGVPGVILGRASDATVKYSHRLGWVDVPLARMVATKVSVPVTVVNETTGLTGAHQWFGGARGRTSVVVFAIGVEIEAGVAVMDELVYGSTGRAGRVSHTRLTPELTGIAESHHTCFLGHKTCIHAYVTRDAIAANAGFPAGDYAKVAEAARYNEAHAVKAFDAAAAALGVAIANVVNTLDPQTVLVTGEASDVIDISNDKLHATLETHLDLVKADELDLRRPGFRYSQYAQGAAIAAILDRFLE